MSHPPMLSPEFFRNMNPTYDWLRENDPLHFIDPIGTWFTSRYDDAVTILQDNENFSVEDMPVAQMWHPNVKAATRTLFMDDPDHARLRAVLQKFFLAPTVRKREAMVREIVDRAVQHLKDSGRQRIDLEKEYAYSIPIDVVSIIMGLPKDDFPLFHKWAPMLNKAMIPTLNAAEKAQAGDTIDEVGAYLTHHFNQGDLRPYGEDTVLSLIKDAVSAGIMTEDEMLPQAMQLYIGGHETTLQLIGLCLHQLLLHPSQLKQLRDDPSLVQKAIDETIRVDGVSQIIVRRVVSDVELHGKTMKANDMLFVGNGAANRDASAYPDPLSFDLERKLTKPHLGFGKGIRYCLGNNLAKLETGLAINSLLQAFPDIRLPSNHEPDYNDNLMMRGLLSLDVELF